jgi:hypothetical protein
LGSASCRWPNGEFYIVSALSKADAIILLDELGNTAKAESDLG